ncbi:MAG: FAD-dependent monooxygenase [Holophagales bacterium]|nr:FAD-dependent monooxygenase [Holophagales bacterium]
MPAIGPGKVSSRAPQPESRATDATFHPLPRSTRHLPPRAIVGGGVAGLATAVAAKRAGCAVKVFERKPATGGEGGALVLASNAIRALRAIGSWEEVRGSSTPVTGIHVSSWSRKPLARFRSEQLSGPLVIIERARLLGALRSALEPDEISSGALCRGFSRLQRGVCPVVDLAGPVAAREEAFAGLVGADGVGSLIRAQLLGGHDSHVPLGWSWIGRSRMQAEIWPAAPGEISFFQGPFRTFTAITAASRESSPKTRRVHWWAAAMGARRRATPASFRSALPMAKALFEHCEGAPRLTGIRDRHPSRCWGRGPVTLVGDAAHPMLPILGQGASQAIAGALELAASLGRTDDVEAAFRAYEQRHGRRAIRITRLSRLSSLGSMVVIPSFLHAALVRLMFPFLQHQYAALLHDGAAIGPVEG